MNDLNPNWTRRLRERAGRDYPVSPYLPDELAGPDRPAIPVNPFMIRYTVAKIELIYEQLQRRKLQSPALRIGPAEMARRIGISPRTLRDWQRKRLIPFERIGPSRGRSIVLFDVAAVDQALKRWRVKSVGD